MVEFTRIFGFAIMIIIIFYLFRIFTRVDSFNDANPEYSYCKPCKPPPCPAPVTCPVCPTANVSQETLIPGS